MHKNDMDEEAEDDVEVEEDPDEFELRDRDAPHNGRNFAHHF